jgi:hypothetical protein
MEQKKLNKKNQVGKEKYPKAIFLQIQISLTKEKE